MPSIFNSLRLLFGLAFGYIMLAELIKFGGESGGLGDIINTSARRGASDHILLVLMIIPLVALAIDRLLFWVQRQLFPYQYGGDGLLHHAWCRVLRCLGGFRRLFCHAKPAETAKDTVGPVTVMSQSVSCQIADASRSSRRLTTDD